MPNDNETPTKKEAAESAHTAQLEDNLSITKHKVAINGQAIAYTVTAGTIVLKEEVEEDEKSVGEKPKATIFFIAYTRDEVEDVDKRPITFSFNGGPGSSSVWLHLGLFGPRRVFLQEDGSAPPPPYRLVDNDYSLLDKTDLVFIDPVSTGFSRAVPGQKSKEFHNYQKDIETVGEFIQLYTSRYNRWASPKFIAGESYGTTRAGGLAGYLHNKKGFYLNGLILVSAVLNFQTLLFDAGNDLPYILFLPTYAATAWYHGSLEEEYQKRELPDFLQEVEEFAMSDYTLALMRGSAIPNDDRREIVRRLAGYTGLSRDFIESSNLRIIDERFNKELLRDRRHTVGRLDSRFLGRDRDAAGERVEVDPSHAELYGAFTAAFNHFVRSELDYQSDLPYAVLASLWQNWVYEEQNRYLDTADALRSAMNMNPNLKVFVANGYYDLATPYLATEYTFNHLSLEPELQGNVNMSYYEAGHMMYTHRPSLARLKENLTGFIDGALPAAEA